MKHSSWMLQSINHVARISLLLYYWSLLQAYIESNMFQHIRPDVLGFNVMAVINQLLVGLFSPLSLYMMDISMWCSCFLWQLLQKRKVRKQHESSTNDTLAYEQSTSLSNDKNEKENESNERPPVLSERLSDIYDFSVVAISCCILPLCNCSFLDDKPVVRLCFYSIGLFFAPLHVRAILKNESSTFLDIPISIALSMNLRWLSLTVGILYQTLLGSGALAVVVVISRLAYIVTRRREPTPQPSLKSPAVRTEFQLRVTRPFATGADKNESQCDNTEVWTKRGIVIHYSNLILCSISTGSLVWITVWVGLSPVLLSRWSDVKSPYPVNCLLAWISAAGCIAATMLGNRLHTNTRPSSIAVLVTGLWCLGLILQFCFRTWCALAGGVLITFTLPIQWMFSLFLISRLPFNLLSNQRALSICIVHMGLAFLVFYFMGVFTTFPLLTTLYWRRMNILFSIVVVVVLFPTILVIGREVFDFISHYTISNHKFVKTKKSRGSNRTVQSKPWHSISLFLMFVACSSLYGVVTYKGPDLESYQAYNKSTIRVMTYNVMMGKGAHERANAYITGNLMHKYQIDVAGLQESHGADPFLGSIDYGYYLASANNMYAHFGVNILRNGGGDACIISRLPFVYEYSQSFPSLGNVVVFNYGVSKVQLALKAHSADAPPRILSVISAHLVYSNVSNDADVLVQPQIDFLSNLLSETPDPVILLADMNITPSNQKLDFLYIHSNMTSAYRGTRDSIRFSTLTANWKAAQPVDHIFYRGLNLAEHARVLNETGFSSDHYPVIADFHV